MEESGVVDSWSVKDLIGHVTMWEEAAMESIRLFIADRDVKTLAWPDVDALNARTVEAKRSAPLADLLA